MYKRPPTKQLHLINITDENDNKQKNIGKKASLAIPIEKSLEMCDLQFICAYEFGRQFSSNIFK